MKRIEFIYLLTGFCTICSCTSKANNEIKEVITEVHNTVTEAITEIVEKDIKPEDIRLDKELLYDKHTLEDTYPYKDTTRHFQWEKIKERLALLENIRKKPAQWCILQNYKNRTGEASDIEVVNDNIQRMVEKYMPTEHNGWKLELSVIPLATKHQTSSETTKRLVIYGFLGFSIFFVAIMNYMLIVIATLGRRAKSVGVHKCNGANNGNIFSMFMMETSIIVLVSILVCAFIIFNARDLIEDLLSVRLASLFTWGTLWVPLLVVVLLFLLAGVLPGRIFSHIPVTMQKL